LKNSAAGREYAHWQNILLHLRAQEPDHVSYGLDPVIRLFLSDDR
jgi:hypothetical protein